MKIHASLFYKKLLKGKYSWEYFNEFKKINKTSPFRYPINNHFVPHNMLMFEKIKDCNNYFTENNIGIQNISFLTSFETIKKNYGNPLKYSIETFNGHTISIAAYYNILENNKSKTVFYFFDNELVETEFLFDAIKKEQAKELFMFYIHKKYITQNELPDSENICIKDKDNNVIFTDWNGFEFSIKYLSAFGSKYRDTITDYYNKVWKIQSKKSVNETISDLDLQLI